MTLYVLCGIPGSGKTTKSKELALQENAKLYSFDSIPGAHDPNCYKEIRHHMHMDIATDLRAGWDVVCDDLNTTLEWRRDILSVLADLRCKKIIIVMEIPLEECLLRNANREMCLPDFVVTNEYNNYRPPTLDEGWDGIIHVKEDGAYEFDFTCD